MNRRNFFTISGLAAAGLTLGGSAATSALEGGTSASAGTGPKAGKGPGKRPVLLKVGCQSGPSNDEHFAYFARYGVRNICAAPKIADGRLYPTVAELEQLKEMANRHGLSVDLLTPPQLPSSHIDRERNPAIMMANSPQRDRDIEAFQNTLRNCAAAGIPAVKYNMSILGVLRTDRDKPLRGDATSTAWDLSKARPETPLTRAGRVDADRFWERITYFLDRVVPVANESKVRIACHPHDPGVPPEGYQGVDRVLGTVDGLKRFVSIRDSAYHGLNFCQGTVSEMLTDPKTQIFDVIRHFGQRKKIFNVHFRNIKGGRNNFQETFPDNGDIDMVRALRAYYDVGYDGMLMPDHVPHAPNDPEGLQSFAFAYGHTRGLIQSLEHSV